MDKEPSDFSKGQFYCRQCMKEYAAEYYIKNKEKVNNKNLARYRSNLDENRSKCREYSRLHKKERAEYNKRYYELNSERIKGAYREYYNRTGDAQRERKSKYYIANKDTILAKNYANFVKRLSEDVEFKVKHDLRRRILSAFKSYSRNGKVKPCSKYGIDFREIIKIIGPRPSRDHQLDHIIPLHLFNYDIEEHVRLSNLPVNLRWISKGDNLRKSGKLIPMIFETPELLEIYLIISEKSCRE